MLGPLFLGDIPDFGGICSAHATVVNLRSKPAAQVNTGSGGGAQQVPALCRAHPPGSGDLGGFFGQLPFGVGMSLQGTSKPMEVRAGGGSQRPQKSPLADPLNFT